jgi:hypothetical protein
MATATDIKGGLLNVDGNGILDFPTNGERSEKSVNSS